MIKSKLTKKLKLFTYLLPLTFLLTACPFSGQKKTDEKLSCDLPKVGYVNNLSDKLDISVNIDGSGSMIGYVTVDNNIYMKTIDAIESVVDSSSKVSVTYNRIGDSKNQNGNRDLVRDAKSLKFYDGSQPEKYKRVSSPIQDAIQSPSGKNDKLTIIVTDLEGDDGDQLSEVIRKKYFNSQVREQGYTVGVWAVKSQFKGNVFDPETSRVKFTYDTNGRSKGEYRPFYVLFIGKYDRIANYLNQIKTLHQDLVDNSEMFIFPASNVVKQAVSLGSLSARESKSVLPDNNQLERLFTLQDTNVTVYTDDDDIPYDFLQIIHEDESVISFDYQVNFPIFTSKDKGGDYTLEIDPNELRFQTKIFTFDPSKQSNVAEPQSQSESENTSGDNNRESQAKKLFSLSNNVNLENILTIENPVLTSKNQTLDFTGQINLNNLNSNDIHLFEVDLIIDNLKDPSWWKNWDYSTGKTNDGSKTENISLLMKKLEQLSLDSLRDEDKNPVIGRLCFAIQKNL